MIAAPRLHCALALTTRGRVETAKTQRQAAGCACAALDRWRRVVRCRLAESCSTQNARPAPAPRNNSGSPHRAAPAATQGNEAALAAVATPLKPSNDLGQDLLNDGVARVNNIVDKDAGPELRAEVEKCARGRRITGGRPLRAIEHAISQRPCGCPSRVAEQLVITDRRTRSVQRRRDGDPGPRAPSCGESSHFTRWIWSAGGRARRR